MVIEMGIIILFFKSVSPRLGDSLQESFTSKPIINIVIKLKHFENGMK